MIAEYFVGITLRGEQLEVHFYPGHQHYTFHNSRGGINRLLHYINRAYPLLILLETSDDRQDYMVKIALQAMRLPVLNLSHHKIEQLSKRLNYEPNSQLSYTGQLAGLGLALRHYAEGQSHNELELPELKSLFQRRQQLLEMRSTEQNRLNTTDVSVSLERYAGKDIQTHILWLEEALEDLDSHLRILWQV